MSDAASSSSAVPVEAKVVAEAKVEKKVEDKAVPVVEKKEEKEEKLGGPEEELTKKMLQLKLQADDGTIIEVDTDVAYKSTLIKNMMENLGHMDSTEPYDEPLPISNIDGKTLEKILEYCKEKRNEVYKAKGDNDDPRIQLTEWDNKFMDVPSDVLLAILMGANYLDIPGIIDITTQKIANMADGKSVEELRELFELENDFTPEEEEEIRQRFAWVEQ